MFKSLHRKCLHEDVCHHILCGAVTNFDYLPANLFANEVVSNVDVFRASMVLIILCDSNGGLVVAI